MQNVGVYRPNADIHFTVGRTFALPTKKDGRGEKINRIYKFQNFITRIRITLPPSVVFSGTGTTYQNVPR